MTDPWFSPEDTFTRGSAAWLAGAVALSALEKYGLGFDRRNPGNRQKWTLTSNWLTVWGWDSITGQSANVRWGRLRRTVGLCLLVWLVAHWTFPVSKRGVY